MNKFWNISSRYSSGKVLDLYVYGEIVTDSDMFFGSEDDVVAREFIQDLHNYPRAEKIHVHINSPGGEVFAAISMAQQLQKHPATVYTYVEGIAASAATIIAMAGDFRYMSKSSLYMVHLPSSSVRGNKYSLLKGVEVLEKIEEVLRMTYATKCKLTDEELTELIDHESWLTADEALQYGFIDTILEDELSKEDLIKNIKNDILNLNGIDVNIAAYAEPDKLRQKLIYIQNKNKGGNSMNFEEFLNSLSEDKRALVDEYLKMQITNSTQKLGQSVSELTSQVNNLTEQLETTKNSLNSSNAELNALKETIADSKDVKDSRTEDQKFLDSLPTEARQAVIQARKATEEANAKIAQMQDEANFATFKENIASYGNLPLQDSHIVSLFKISKACPEEYANIEALFKVANESMVKQFSQIGIDGDNSVPDNAYAEIENRVKALMQADDSLDYNTAFSNVVRECPDLYARYRQGL